MSDCCCYPGVGEEPDVKLDPTYKSYNPAEVRLYGRPSRYKIEKIEPIDDCYKELLLKEFANEETLNAKFGEKKDEAMRLVNDIVNSVESRIQGISKFFKSNISVAIRIENEIQYFPITLYLPWLSYDDDATNYIKSIGVIYGYAYEGHCYSLTKPKLMLLPERPRRIPKEDRSLDCGYSPKLGYAVWQLDKLSRAVAFDIMSDDIKTLILDANMPGNRSPMAYAQAQSLAPQRSRE